MMPLKINEDGLLEVATTKRVELNPYIPREPLPRPQLTDQELIDNAGGTLIVDTETYPNFFLAAFKCYKTKKYLKLTLPFNTLKLAWILQSYRTVGFNSNRYDMLMLWCSYMYQDTQYLKRLSDRIILGNVFARDVMNEFKFQTFPTRHVDLIEVCPLSGSLKLYMARLHAPRIQEMQLSPHEPISSAEKAIVTDYCCNDLDGTELLLDNLKEQLQLRENLSIEYRQDVMSKSDAQIAETVIGSELRKITGKWPKKPEIVEGDIHKFKVPANMSFQTDALKRVLNIVAEADFCIDYNGRLEAPKEITTLRIPLGKSIYRMGIGGLHSSEEMRAVKSNNEYQLFDVDVESYYPRIVLNLGLHPRHLGEDFLNVYSTIVQRRIDAKKNKNIAQSENLKVTINGTFGKTGSPYSILYAPEMTIQITVGGQLYLLMLIEKLELASIPVVSANTDGILVHCPRAKIDEFKSIVKAWEQVTGFKTEEAQYAAVYSRDVNAYLAVKANGETKGKNAYYDPWTGKTAKDKYWRFQKNPTAQICVEAAEKLIVHGIPIEKTITECRDFTRFVCVRNVTGGAHKNRDYLGKTIRWYYANKTVGTINYIISNNTVPDSEGAKPCMDLPTEFPTDVDYNRYVKKTLTLLEDCGYLKRQEQLKFF
jgi:hypothetical protein